MILGFKALGSCSCMGRFFIHGLQWLFTKLIMVSIAGIDSMMFATKLQL